MIEIHNWSNQHLLYKCKVSDFLNIPIQNWCHNRPPDVIRCRDISRYLLREGTVLDGEFSVVLQENGEQPIYYMIDGIHRYTSLKMIAKDEPNLVSPPTILNSIILVRVRKNLTNGEIVDWFQSINKSIPVPDLYIKDNTTEKKRTIEHIVEKWTLKYPSHFTSSRTPNIPNTNREMFIGFLDKLYDKYEKEIEVQKLLLEKLEIMNEEIKNKTHPKVSSRCIEKCKETGCYLFLVKLDKLEKMILY